MTSSVIPFRELILDHAFGLVLVLARIGPICGLLPGLGETTIPAMVKAGLILALTLLLLPGLEPTLPPRPANELALALTVLTEMLNGLWFGWLARVLTSSLPLAGQLIADFTGLSNVLVPSPELGPQTSAVSRLYEAAVPALLLSSGLYMLPLSALAGFYRLVPPGSPVWAPDSADMTVSAVAECFNLALRLSAPFVLVAIAWNVAIGLIARLVPRLQVFFVALPGQIGLGLLLLAVLSVPLIAGWIEAMRTSLAALPGGN